MGPTKGTAPADLALLKALHVMTQLGLNQAAELAEAADQAVERWVILEERVYSAYISSTAFHREESESASEANLGPEDRDVGHDGQQPVV